MSSEIAEAVAAMIASRAAERTAEYQRRQAAAAEVKAELQERRRHGLTARHRRKLARQRTA